MNVYYLAIRPEHFMRLLRMKKATERSMTEMVNEAVQLYLDEFYPLLCRKLPVLIDEQQRLLDEECWQAVQEELGLNNGTNGAAPSHGQPINNIWQLAESVPDFWFKGTQTKLAQEAGVSDAWLSRVINGRIADPSYGHILAIVEVLEKKLERKLDPREIFRP